MSYISFNIDFYCHIEITMLPYRIFMQKLVTMKSLFKHRLTYSTFEKYMRQNISSHISGLQPSGFVFLWPIQMWYTTASDVSRFGYGNVPEKCELCFKVKKKVT